MADIPALKAEVKRLREELQDAEDELREALIDATGFRVGEVVEARMGYSRAWREWQPAIIRAIYTKGYSDDCRFVVSFAKKDGGWRKNTHDYAEVRKSQK